MRLIAALAVAACGTEPSTGPTGSTCPTPPVTYAEFAAPFMNTYCLSCHSSSKSGDARQDAPPGVDFDTQALLRMHTANIDKTAAFGPDAENATMPPAGALAPSRAQRLQLGQYIACEVGR